MEYFIRFCREQWEFGRKGENVISVRFRRPPSRAVLKMSEQGFILETVLEKGVNVQ